MSRECFCEDRWNVDIVFAKAFKSLNLKMSKPMTVRIETYGISPDELLVLGWIELLTMITCVGPEGKLDIPAL